MEWLYQTEPVSCAGDTIDRLTTQVRPGLPGRIAGHVYTSCTLRSGGSPSSCRSIMRWSPQKKLSSTTATSAALGLSDSVSYVERSGGINSISAGRWASRYPRFVRYFSRTGRYQLASANPKQRVTFPRIARYISGASAKSSPTPSPTTVLGNGRQIRTCACGTPWARSAISTRSSRRPASCRREAGILSLIGNKGPQRGARQGPRNSSGQPGGMRAESISPTHDD